MKIYLLAAGVFIFLGVVVLKTPALIQIEHDGMCKDSGVAKIDTALSMPKNEARALNSGNVVRLKCFGDTIAWTIYSIDNGMVAPDLKDFLDASEKYKRCVWSSGEKEYLISPPLDTPSV